MKKALGCLGVLVVVGMIGLALEIAVPTSRTEAPTAMSGTKYSGPRFLDGAPDSIVLNYRTGDLYIRTSAVAAGVPRPDTVWVWAYFVVPDLSRNGSWSDEPIPVAATFAEGDTALLEARGRFHWWDNANVDPSLATYAMVTLSAHGADSARVVSRMRTYETRRMKRVTVLR
jgi:hypothetical protein